MGASKTCLLTVYRTLIRSLLDYGAIVLEKASPKVKATLDTVQCKALKICCGAMKGTSPSALQSECGEMPLSLRRHMQQIEYCIKVKCTINHCVVSVLRTTGRITLVSRLQSQKTVHYIVMCQCFLICLRVS